MYNRITRLRHSAYQVILAIGLIAFINSIVGCSLNNATDPFLKPVYWIPPQQITFQWNLGPNIEIFINSDNDPTSGFQHSGWSSSGADYMTANSILCKSTADDVSWSWDCIDDMSSVVFVRKSSLVEMSIKKQ